MAVLDRQGVAMAEATTRGRGRTRRMRVARRQVVVDVLDLRGVVPRPQRQGGGEARRPERREGQERRLQPRGGAEPAGERVGDQPTGVAEGELRGEQRGPVARVRFANGLGIGRRFRMIVASGRLAASRRFCAASGLEHRPRRQPEDASPGPVWRVPQPR